MSTSSDCSPTNVDFLLEEKQVKIRVDERLLVASLQGIGHDFIMVNFARRPSFRLNETVEFEWNGEWTRGMISEFAGDEGSSRVVIQCPDRKPEKANSNGCATATTGSSCAETTAKLLFVDDDEDQLKLIVRFSSAVTEAREKLTVMAISDPVIAEEWIDKGGVDILITDLDMPTVDGLELLRRAKGRNAHTQVIFMTANSTHEALLEAMEHGASDYLIKPIKKDTLNMLIEQALERKDRWCQSLAKTWKPKSSS